jgi:uncharacterized protein (TIGR00255 family)
MVTGMTGFGTTQIATPTLKVQVDIKTVNHRYLDLSFHLPSGFLSCEHKIKHVVQQKIERGRVTVVVRIIQSPGKEVLLNKDVVKKYIQYAKTLQREVRDETELSARDLISLPGVVEVKDFFVEVDDIWPLLERGIKKVVDGVVVMRRREGMSLVRDVRKQLRMMAAKVKTIRVRSERVLSQKRKELSPEEFKSFQRNIDSNEEVSRLTHYIEELQRFLSSTESAGKQIDFIAQEMQRESNTIGSKMQDVVVSTAVIALKSCIEKIREQAQNIE